jgi:cysteine desulfurase
MTPTTPAPPRFPIYLDYHATTPCHPRVVDAMIPWFTEQFGNPASRTHSFGFAANAAVERAREQVAALVGASPKEIIFTSGATEADNLAVLGVAEASPQRRRVIVSAFEHKAVLDPALYLERRGWDVVRLPVSRDGLVSIEALTEALRTPTALVSVMLANNEVGTVQPIAALAAEARAAGAVFHTDAAQCPGKIPVRIDALGADLISLSAHKCYGPKGIGALWVRRGRPKVPIAPILHGGGHERGLRSGTLPTPLIVGFGVAAEIAAEDLTAGEPARLARLRDRLLEGFRTIGGVHVNGTLTDRLPNNLHVSFDGVDGEALLLSVRELALSSGSACTSASLEPSHVLRAMGVSSEHAHGSLRFGLGRGTTEADVEVAVRVVTERVTQLRAMPSAAFAGEPAPADVGFATHLRDGRWTPPS